MWPEWFIKPIERQTGFCDRIWSKRECKRDAGRKTGERKGREKTCTAVNAQLVELKNRTWSSNVCLQHKKPTISWMQHKGFTSRLREVNLCFWSDEDPPGTPCPAVESLPQEHYGPVRVGAQVGWSTYAIRKSWESWGCSSQRKGGSEETL